ncbi:MAG: hypothetical protein ABIJ09_10135 [Pseudomonadota bacterium]
MTRHGLPSRLGLLLGLASLAGCGLETLCTTTGFNPTPKPRAVIKGKVADLPAALEARVQGLDLVLRVLSVDGVELASGDARFNEDFSIELPEAQDHFNVRVVVQGGTLLLKTLVPEARAGTEIHVGTVGASVTAHAVLAERSAQLERGVLASMPPQVLGQVLGNAAGSSDADVQAFRAMVRKILDVTSPLGEVLPALSPAGSDGTQVVLEAAGVSVEAFNALRDRAARAIAVPVVCDPSRLRVLFACDISGQALDGNGVVQSIRQPPRAGKVFLGITLDPSSPVADVEGALRRRLTPNDAQTEMFDDGSHGDELAGDKVYSLTLDLPRGMRVIYKYTDGSTGEGFTGTEEWPGNARILQVEDLLTGVEAGTPDCILVRRDSFGDESSNKNFVNLNARLGGAALGYGDDLGGIEVTPVEGDTPLSIGGLALGDIHLRPPLTPAGIPEARENGVCGPCPAPLTVATDDREPPRLVASAFIASDRVRASFSEDLDLATASDRANYRMLDGDDRVIAINAVRVRGASVTLEIESVDPNRAYILHVAGVADASADKNVIADGAHVAIGPDQTPPTLDSVRTSTITEVNPAARPEDPSTGQVVVLGFSETLDRISAENVGNYRILSAGGVPLDIYAAFQRGRELLLVTATQSRGGDYQVQVSGPFDQAGNMMADASLPFTGLALYRVSFGAVVDYAFLSEDGRERGLPAGEQLYLTGTVMLEARATDGRDLRMSGRTDVAGIAGYAFAPTADLVAGKPVHRLSLFLPPGVYAWKVGHGTPAMAADPPATLETVTKNLCTTNDNTGVTVDPVTLLGRDGISYQGARLSLTGNDTPGPAVLFKRENPDQRLLVGAQNMELPVFVIGAWRDVPFGSGADYDDGRVELAQVEPGAVDDQGPRLLDASAPCSAGVLLSFDEKILSSAAEVQVQIQDADGVELNARVQHVGLPVKPTQVFVQTAEQFPGAAYSLGVSGLRDAAGNLAELQSGAFVAPGAASECRIVDEDPPEVVAVLAERPDRIRVRFSEQIHSASAGLASFGLVHRQGGNAPTIQQALLSGGGTEVVLVTSAQEIQAPYTLTVHNIQDIAQPANVLVEQSVDFAGFGEHEPPTFSARAVTPGLVWLRFNEPVTEATASAAASYSIPGLTIQRVEFSAAASLRASSTAPAYAPIAEDQVLLSTSPMSAGQSYTVTVNGVHDLSGNVAASSASFDGLAAAPTVDLVIEVLVSRTATVFGAGPGGSSGVPGRALSPETLAREREGIFMRGEGLEADGATTIPSHPATLALQGFPARGAAGLAQFDGPDPQLRDDATGGDRVAGDNIYTLVIPGVPLGSVVAYKTFASFSTAFRDSSGDPRALVADATPGPSQYDDGEEYPGNDNGARILGDSDGDGQVVLRHLFGDEVTYKRREDSPVFAWVDDGFERIP